MYLLEATSNNMTYFFLAELHLTASANFDI